MTLTRTTTTKPGPAHATAKEHVEEIFRAELSLEPTTPAESGG